MILILTLTYLYLLSFHQWANEKLSREARIQELYDQIEPLWTRMGEEQDYIDVFIDSNRGSGEATIRAVGLVLFSVLSCPQLFSSFLSFPCFLFHIRSHMLVP